MYNSANPDGHGFTKGELIMIKKTRKHISHLALAVAMLLAFGIPVSVAAAEAEEAAVARDASRYISFDLTLYRGVWAYSSSAENKSNKAYVNVNHSSCSPVSIGIFDASHSQINVKNSCSVPGGYTFNTAHQYPGQNICVGFYTDKITGKESIDGSFYYNGLN